MSSDRHSEELAARLHAASFKVLRIARREGVESGVAGPRLSALSAIARSGAITMADLARAEQVRPPTMTRLVDALVAAGFVERVADASDRRRVRVRATESGTALLGDGRPRLRALKARLQRFGESELRAIARGIELIERALKA